MDGCGDVLQHAVHVCRKTCIDVFMAWCSRHGVDVFIC
jgi:hypothetical protein